ncbi:MAG: hypothetical protein ACRCTS_02270 [Fusobacteriaceae bacterium]
MKKIKNKGFILKQTVFLAVILLGIFSFLNKTVRLRGGRGRMEGENRKRDYLLETVQEIALYELYLLDGYLKEGRLENLEEYFYRDSSGKSILNHYHGFTTDREKNFKSMGGYRLTHITPDPAGIYIPNFYRFSIILSKEMELADGEEELLRAVMRTGYIEVRCHIDPYEEKIDCGNLGRIQELNIFGEEKNDDEEKAREKREKISATDSFSGFGNYYVFRLG